MDTLVEKLSKCWDYFLRLSGFPDLSRKVFLFTFPNLIIQQCFVIAMLAANMEKKKSLLASTNQDSTFSHNRENSEMFNITSKYFSFFNNKPPVS